MTPFVFSFSHRRAHTRMLAAAMVACMSLVSVAPAAVCAQTPTAAESGGYSYRTGIELSAQGGLLRSLSTISPATNAAAPQSTPTIPVLRSAQAGIHTRWQSGPFAADAAIYLNAAAALGMRSIQPLGLFHISAQRGNLTLSLGVEQATGVFVAQHVSTDTGNTTPGTSNPFDTLTTGTPQSRQLATTNVASLVRLANIVGGLGWNVGPGTLQFVSGIRASDLRNGLWVGTNLAVGIGQSSALLLSVRHQSRASELRMPAFTVGFRTSYWRWGIDTRAHPVTSSHTTDEARATSAVRVKAGNDSIHLQLFLPSAHHVVIMGDATQWESVAMTRDPKGWWHVSLPVANATSRVQIRSDDGTWRPVPGLPTTRDEYGGMVSLLVATEPSGL